MEIKKYKKVEISEFFERNKHILGFDNPSKAIMTCLKEFCDNSLDACEDEKILPELEITIIKKNNSIYRIIFKDNGPGVTSAMIPKVFGKLLFGSKFHENKQKRGQQGLGASAVVLYSQLTTGSPVVISNRVGNGIEERTVLGIDIKKNEPTIFSKKTRKSTENSGITIEVDLEATFFKLGPKAVSTYLTLINTINPSTRIILIDPEEKKTIWERTTTTLGNAPQAYKYHCKDLDIGLLKRYILENQKETVGLGSILDRTFESLTPSLISKICRLSGNSQNIPCSLLTTYEFIQLKTIIDSLSIPEVSEEKFSICGQELEKHLSKIYKSKEVDFLEYHKSKIGHYNGGSFIVETVLCYGGTLAKDKKMEIIRVGNKVPFLFQGGACALQKTIASFNWKSVGFSQNQNEVPVGPAICYIHLVSTKIPFISESKEAVSEVPPIIEAINECLRETSKSLIRHIEFQLLAKKREEKKEIVEKFFPLLVQKICKILKKDVKEYPEVLNKINQGIIIKKTNEKSFRIQNLYPVEKKLCIDYGGTVVDIKINGGSIIYFNPEESSSVLFKKLKVRNQSKTLKIFIE